MTESQKTENLTLEESESVGPFPLETERKSVSDRKSEAGRKSVRKSAAARGGRHSKRLSVRKSQIKPVDIPESHGPLVRLYLEEDQDVESFDSDNDGVYLESFDEDAARQELLNFPDTTKIILTIEQQQDIGLEVGVHVTAEMPWKLLDRDVVLESLPQGVDESIDELRLKIGTMREGDSVLIGYLSALSEDNDTFLVFENIESAKLAAQLIRGCEAAERRRAKLSMYKRPRPWTSYGSEHEIEIVEDYRPEIEVEIQSVFPVKRASEKFEFRLVSDVRDGYVAMLPGKKTFDVEHLQFVDACIQSSPARISTEQQTDPTFPTNAWSQYFYEISTTSLIKKDTVAEDQPADGKRKIEEMPPEPYKPSAQIIELLNTLEFNQVNMYRNDYEYIAKTNIPVYQPPNLIEKFCFSDIAKTSGRYISSIDWHPIYSGLVLISYAFSTISTTVKDTDLIDSIQRTTLQSNPVLLWSFDDSLEWKFELCAPREIVSISYCPFDENLIIGGAVNGQLVIWDVSNRLQKVERIEVLTPAQVQYRRMMRSFLAWTNETNRDRYVRFTALSDPEFSHRSAVTGIKWLDRHHVITEEGQVRSDPSGVGRLFATYSLDGTIAFWNMDMAKYLTEARRIRKKQKPKLPPQMMANESEFDDLHLTFKPTFIICYERPLTSMIFDHGIYSAEPIGDRSTKLKLFSRIEHKVTDVGPADLRNSMFVSTITGQFGKFTWEGFEFSQGALISRETIKQPTLFETIHPGPIFTIDRNPFYPELVLSIDSSIVCVWHDNQLWTPIIWRRRLSKLTFCRWSKKRPAVFFVCREDGSFEAWDLLARMDEPCLIESLGGNVLTTLSQHRLTLSNDTICIGDYNSSLRVFILPEALTKILPSEKWELMKLIEREMQRLNHLSEWQHAYYMSNAHIRTAKQKAMDEEQFEIEKLKKRQREEEEIRLRRLAEEERKALKKAHSKAVFDLPERRQKQWNENNLRRLMKVLMAMKMVDPQLLAKLTKPEKDRMAYNERKKEAIDTSYERISADISILKMRIMPPDEIEDDRMALIKCSLTEMYENDLSYDEILGKAFKSTSKTDIPVDQISGADISDITIQLDQASPTNNKMDSDTSDITISLDQILRRGRQRRLGINRMIGGNVQHRQLYQRKKSSGDLRAYLSDIYKPIVKETPSAQSFQSVPNL